MNPLDLPREFQLVFWSVIGLFVGSFLNVAIHRLPLDGQSVSRPRRSQCPNCGRVLTWKENVPLLSWTLQRGRCRGCRWPIPWRYPLVELLTALLWALVAWETLPPGGRPLALRLGALGRAALGRVRPDRGHLRGLRPLRDPRRGLDRRYRRGPDPDPDAAPHSRRRHHRTDLLGGAWSGPSGGFDRLRNRNGGGGAGILLAIGWLGKLVFGRDAMGLGDVKLLAAAGGFIGAVGVVFALIAGSLVASLAGIANMVRMFAISRARVRSRGATKSVLRSLQSARIAGRYIPFGPYLAIGIGIVLLYWNDVKGWI